MTAAARIVRKGNNASIKSFVAKYAAMGWLMREAVRYQRVTIDADGANNFTLFQVTRGADGIAVTNFELAGKQESQVAAAFNRIHIDIEPAGNPAAFGAQAAANRINDAHYLNSRGLLKLTKGSSKETIVEAGPLRVFPGNAGIAGMVSVADATTLGSDKQSRVQTVHTIGPAFTLNNPWVLGPDEIFGGRLEFGDAALALPSNTDASLLIRFHGIEFVKR